MGKLLLCGLWAATLFAAPPQVLNIGNGDEPKDLDPAVTTGVPEHHIQQNLFEPLVVKDPKTLGPIPGVAESWKVSADGKTYTFKLRKNAKWSNGDPVTAKDFVYAWKRLLEPKTAAEYAYQGYVFKNGKAFNTGKLTDSTALGFKAVDPYTLVVELEQPTSYFLSLLYHHSMYPVHQATLEKHGSRWTRPENCVSNGAFRLTKWEIKNVIQLKKNPNYWDAKNVKLEEVNFLPVQQPETEERLFRSGKLDVTNGIPLEKIPSWQKDSTGVYQQNPYLGIYYLWINVQKPPLDKKEVRKALNLAFDRSEIVQFVTRAGQIPATGFTPPGTGGYTPPKVLPDGKQKLAQAKELLAKAGYPGGKGFPKIEMLYNTETGHKKIGEALQQQWRQNLGIEVALVNQEWKVYLDTLRTAHFDLARAGWIGDYNDPNTFLDLFVTGGGNNRSRYSNAEYDKLIAQAAKELKGKPRMKAFEKAENILLEELPVIPIYVYTRVYLLAKKVKGWYPNIEDIHPLKFVSIE